jgi:hypothetical protein
MVVKVTVDYKRWGPRRTIAWLLGCGGTPISSELDSLSDRTAKWFGDAKDELSPSGV